MKAKWSLQLLVASGLVLSPVFAAQAAGEAFEAHALVPDVVDDEAVWACTTCGACVEECPVDIKHIDTIVDMRRVLVMGEDIEGGYMSLKRDGERWVFGYGSLMWRPGFSFLERRAARLHGAAEALSEHVRREGALAGADAGFEHVVQVRIFLTDFERDYAPFNRLYATYFSPDRLPARTTVGVTHLARGGIVEIDMIAHRL